MLHKNFSISGLTSGEIQSSSGKYRKKEYDIEEYMVRSRLTILNFGPEDVGTYKCVCKNDMNLLGDKVQAKISVGLATSQSAYIYFQKLKKKF